MTDRNYLKEVEDTLRKKRENAQALSEMRRAEVHRMIPETEEIDRDLFATGSEILTAMMSGGDVKAKVEKIRERNAILQNKRADLLKKNGYPADYTSIKYDCPICADSGYIGINMCSCMRCAIANLRLSDSELGRLSDSQSFDNFDITFYAEGKDRTYMEHISSTLKKYAENFNSSTVESWLLLGNTGLGKTHLSTAVGISVIKKGYDVLYRSVQSLIDDFEEVQFKGGKSNEVKGYYDADLLIIDDLGAEMSTQFTVSCIYNIINARMNKRKPTIISTNLTQQELRDRYADRITSRLFGEYIPLVFIGKDIRQQKLMRGLKK